MMGYDWSQDMATGIEKIDNEHQELFRRVKHLLNAVNQNRGKEVIDESLMFFVSYTQAHFQYEERLHRECGAPGYDAHVAAHRSVVAELDAFLRSYRAEGITASTELIMMNRVVRALMEQLHDHDIPLAKHIQGKGAFVPH